MGRRGSRLPLGGRQPRLLTVGAGADRVGVSSRPRQPWRKRWIVPWRATFIAALAASGSRFGTFGPIASSRYGQGAFGRRALSRTEVARGPATLHWTCRHLRPRLSVNERLLSVLARDIQRYLCDVVLNGMDCMEGEFVSEREQERERAREKRRGQWGRGECWWKDK